jgi:pyrroloquinoline quinone biosynthesis protein D
MNEIVATARPLIGRGFRLQWEPAQNTHVLLYPEGMVKLNPSAGEILSRCDGKRTLDEIIVDLERTFNQPGLTQDVTNFVNYAVQQRWLEIRA